MRININQPYNDLPLLPPKVNLLDTDILLKTIEVERAIAQLRTRLTLSRRSVANTLDLLSPLFVPEAVASSGVENIITTNNSVYVAKLKEERDLASSEKETMRYADALMLGAKLINKNGFLATNDYLRIQAVLEPNKKGIRKIPGTQLRNYSTGRVYYTPPEGESLIRDKLANYEQYYNEQSPMSEVYARMAILHYQLEAIHPFMDGNGRTGRILMPLYLTLQKELPVPVLFISQYILNHRDEYYERLRAVTNYGRWKPWILYIMAATKEQADYTTRILDKIQRNLSEVKLLLKEKYKNMYSAELLDFMFSRTYFTEKQFEEELHVSFPTARKYLACLEREGIVQKRMQSGRNRFLYINKRYASVLLSA